MAIAATLTCITIGYFAKPSYIIDEADPLLILGFAIAESFGLIHV